MSSRVPFPEGGYAFLEGVYPYSQGVAALPGFAIERPRFARPVPVAMGFDLIARHLAGIQRPLTALRAAELRSPKPFTFSGFAEFNKGYVAVLEKWGLYRGGRNPVARSNVAPEEAGMRAKTDFVLAQMDSRLKGLGVGWSRATVSQPYTVFDVQKQIGQIQKHVQPSSLTWHYCRPPIEGLDYEMDLRGVSVERVLA